MPENTNLLERALKRERTARKRAEKLLETRSLELYKSNKSLQESYLATVEVFANLLGGRNNRSPESLRKLGRDAKVLANCMNLNDNQKQDIYIAGVLCDLGKLSLPDEITSKPLVKLSAKERKIFCTHPQLGHDALMALAPLEPVAQTILQHCEYYNGSGYPNRLQGNQISLSGRILCIVKDFDALLRGILLAEELSQSEAITYLRSHRGTHYDENLVDEFIGVLETSEAHNEDISEQRLTPSSLREGMLLTRDLMSNQGVMILPEGQRLSAELIGKLQRISKQRGSDILLYVGAKFEG